MPAEKRHPGRRFGRLAAGAAVALAAWLAPAAPAGAQLLMKERPEEIRGLEVIERVGEPVAMDVPLTDSKGNTVTLAKMFDGELPVVLALVYYDCPITCPAVLGKLQETFKAIDHSIGRDYRVAIVSFDPDNTTAMAAQQKMAWMAGYNYDGRGVSREQVEAGWEFFTSSALSARRLADSIGFQYRYIPETGDYAHPTMFVVLTPKGLVARYFYVWTDQPRDVKLALLEASEGRTARTLGDRILMFCYHYDPSRGAYTLQAMRLMQAGGVVAMVLVGGLVLVLKLTESSRRPATPPADGPEPAGQRA